MNSETATKTERLRRSLCEKDLGGVLLASQHNFAWLTGGRSNGINTSVENGACFLLVTNDGRKFVLANNIEMPRILDEELSPEEFEPVSFPWQAEKASFDAILGRAGSLLRDNKVIASDLFLDQRIRTVEYLISSCRCELTEPEVERYRKLGEDADAAIGIAIRRISPGQSELEIAQTARKVLAEFNIQPVVLLVGADRRIESFRHPVPTNNVWERVLLIAVCAKRGGLIANLTRMVCAGSVPAELEDKTAASAFVHAKLVSRTRPDAEGHELYRAAAEAYSEAGFPDEINLHHQGGATGYKTRDWVIHPQSSEKVRGNQAFAWNPSITGTKVEDTFVVRGDESEVLTATSSFPQIRVEIDGQEYFSSGVLGL